jgi:hypothetical protein
MTGVFKPPDGLADAPGEVGEQRDDLLPPLSLSERWFVQRYLKAECHLLIRFLSHSEDFVAMSKVADIGGRHVRPDAVLRDDDFLHRGDCRQQQAVFVDDVELVETPVGVVPSLVRLQLFERGRCGDADSFLYLGQNGFEFVRVGRDWESVIASGSLVVGGDEFAVEDVERGAEVVDRVSGDEADFLARRRNVLAKATDYLAGIRVFLTEDSIRGFGPQRESGGRSVR